MKAYFIRRLLLIPLTLIGITIVVFFITNVLPGPMEASLARMMGGQGGGGAAKRSRAEAGVTLTAAQVLEQEEKFNRDKAPWVAYMEWLGAMPRDLLESKVGVEMPPGERETTVTLPGTVQDVKVVLDEQNHATLQQAPQPEEENMAPPDLSLWKVRVRTPEEQQKRWQKWVKDTGLKQLPNYRVIVYQSAYDGLLEGSLGTSEKYQDPVFSIILSKMPVAIYFGLLTAIITYGISIPLGILKAVRHRGWLDNASSVAMLFGYAVPGYALGSILLVYLGAKWGLLPIRGLTGDDFATMAPWDKVKDLAAHTLMPLLCYLVGSFAFLTLLVKNNLMDTLAADYVRTAMAKGVSYPSAVFRHAFRNSLIPLASTCGDLVLILVGGSVLVEKVFDIDGFGLLSLSSVAEYDRTMIMGVVVVSSFLTLLGNVVSDLAVALVDPKVSYN